MSRSRLFRIGVLTVAVSSAVMVSVVSLAWACTPGGTLSLDRTIGPPGATVTATVTNSPAGEVKFRWISPC